VADRFRSAIGLPLDGSLVQPGYVNENSRARSRRTRPVRCASSV